MHSAAVRARTTVCVNMVTHVRELQRSTVGARCAVAGGWALPRRERAAARPAHRGRTDPRAHPYTGAVAAASGGGGAATARRAVHARGARARASACVRAGGGGGGRRPRGPKTEKPTS